MTLSLQRRIRAPEWDATQEHAMATAHDFRFRRLCSGEDINLSQFAGSVLLVVNVASACGYTPQYRDLEALYEAKKAKGLVVLGVPSNDFGAQEQGSEEDIASFCDASYHVTFPMTSKVEILSANRHPFYDWISEQAGSSALPRWNFHKYLVGKRGELINAFPSSAAPLGPEMLTAIDRALAG